MKEIKFYTVIITNWEKWNGTKTTDWFKLSTSFPYDPKIMALNNSEFRLYVSLLALAGRSRSEAVQFTASSVTVGHQFRGSSLPVALAKLSELGLLKIQKERKKEKKERIYTSTEENFRLRDADIDPIYKKYPRKIGKKKGYEKLKKIIKSESDLEKFKRAVEKFCEIMAKEKRDPDKILYFQTFVNDRWEDFLDEDVGTHSNQAEEIEKEKKKQQFEELWGDL